jgi:dCTP diphosphatase
LEQEGYTLEGLMALIREFIQARDWERFNTPSALALSAAVEMGELLEKFQWLTDNEVQGLLQQDEYRTGLADEIADVMVYLLRIFDTTGISPTGAILDKMKKNEVKYPADSWRGRTPDKVRSH